LKRAFDTAPAIKKSGQRFDAESDEELEAALRRELIARFNGISDPKDIERHFVVAGLPMLATDFFFSNVPSIQVGHFARTSHLVQMNSVVEVFSPSAFKAKPSLTASTLKRTLPMKG
jgi:hypothetical protein